MNQDSRSFDGGCFLFTCGCLSGGCLGVVLVGALAIGLMVYALQIGFIDNPRSYAYIHVEGDEMSPTLRDGDWILVSREELKVSEVKRREIVWVEPPEEARRTGRLFLRVAGLPGETVSFGSEGDLRIQEEPLTGEPFEGKDFRMGEEIPETLTLGDGEFYLLGEEPTLAKDSRQWGPVDAKYLRGKAKTILFPPGRVQTIED